MNWHDFKDSDFRELFALYRKHHPAGYAVRIAYDIAFNNIPF